MVVNVENFPLVQKYQVKFEYIVLIIELQVDGSYLFKRKK